MSLAGFFPIVGWVVAMWFIVRPLGVAWARRAELGRALSPAEMAALTTVFGVLGAEDVARGLTATGHGWHDCFLTLATSGAARAARGLAGRWPSTRAGLLGALIGASPHAVRAAARAWDAKEAAFRALATEWLEQNATRGACGSTRRMVA